MAVKDDEFFESLYATLACWGMHRMGRQPAKLRDSKASVRAFFGIATTSVHLKTPYWQTSRTLRSKTSSRVYGRLCRACGSARQTPRLWQARKLSIMCSPNWSHRSTANIRSSFSTATSGPIRVVSYHCRAVPHYRLRCRRELDELLQGATGSDGMNTSTTKVIDNAIVGDALCHPKSVRLPAQPA